MLSNPRNVERVADGAHSDDKDIVLDIKFMFVAHPSTADEMLLRIQCTRFGVKEADIFPCVPDRLDDTSEFYRADRGARQEGCKKEMVARADDGDIVIVLEMLDEIERSETGSENDKAREGHARAIGVME